ncbi:hypothetical protein OIY81_2612 [Cryptosporidium canis]|uniref:Uncharacterized protein n=1 Tax=Cryptosporidium canis TaxID=195482 RepID=A0ABQ8P3T7_9CRYT|nr:hypothetical protein OJ252_3065 [Cryptosporidium canis]KAJ1608535.1 hypothetical protein OIY81_2612 [Cryptosporidium canis]
MPLLVEVGGDIECQISKDGKVNEGGDVILVEYVRESKSGHLDKEAAGDGNDCGTLSISIEKSGLKEESVATGMKYVRAVCAMHHPSIPTLILTWTS